MAADLGRATPETQVRACGTIVARVACPLLQDGGGNSARCASKAVALASATRQSAVRPVLGAGGCAGFRSCVAMRIQELIVERIVR
jgi:hypothetical protein